MITLRCGKLGQGKSYSATRDVWNTINNGFDAYVNWKIDFTAFYLRETSGWRGFFRGSTITKHRRPRLYSDPKAKFWRIFLKN
jgi:hypothetical protein